jgi:thiamine pyrophosphate-dependent acetolactate synthase large subunit-like protein
MNVCQVLIDVLSQYGVKHIFGIPGDAINELIEAIRKQDKIKFIHCMHEEAGAFAAAAQAKLNGELAVCCGTAGPGAIHLLNGLYDAKLDRAPVLAITGQVNTDMQGTYYQQEVNLMSLYQDVTVYNQTLVNPDQFPRMVHLAIRTALSEKGVAHISIPADLSFLRVKNYEKGAGVMRERSMLQPATDQVQKAAALINKAKKPCVLAGIGAREAADELLELAQKIQAPIIKALRGKDIIPDLHPYVLGGTGHLGNPASTSATRECDVFIIVGSDFPYPEYYPKGKAPVIQIDNDMKHIGRRNHVEAGIVGDSKIVLTLLLPLVEAKHDQSFLKDMQLNKKSWLDDEYKTETEKAKYIHPQSLAKTVSNYSDDNAVICCDTGAVTVWAARNFYLKADQRFTLSGGLASMAFGMPAALGAKLLYPNRQVIAFCGDGGFAMLMCDFATAVKYKLDIKVFIFNNGKLGLIQMEEEAFAGNPEYQTDLHNPDYAAFAESCGGEGFTVREYNDLAPTVEKALKSKRPTVVNVYVNPNELTMPPEITVHEASNYVKAKMKEYLMK